MKKLTILILLALGVTYSYACTNIIVGKKASKDGSVLVSYNADSYGAFMGLKHFPAGTHQKGEMRKVYDWDSNKYLGEIPEAPVTYNVVGNTNEWQVAIGETTYGGREEMCDSTGKMDYGSMIYIALQRSKTAREAIKVMTSLAETYGYCSEGETFSICDKDEAWIMELQAKGPGSKSVVWVALRVPDDCVCAHANQSRIRQFNMKDKQNVMYSKDVIKFAREKGWFKGKDADFSWADAYCPADFSARRFCEARVWSIFNRFSEKGFMDEYLPWALGKDTTDAAKPMPLFIKPKALVGVAEVEAAMRDHYEGTPMALDNPDDPGQGLWTAPYRPTPLEFKVIDVEKKDTIMCFNERPVSTQQTSFAFVAQLRSSLPRQIGSIIWFGNDDGNMVTYVPMYSCITSIPECFDETKADGTHFNMNNAYWVCNWVSNMVYPRYEMMFPELRLLRDSLDNRYFDQQPKIEAEALKIHNSQCTMHNTTDGDEPCVKYLSDYSVREAQSMLAAWQKLAWHLIVKYNDQCVKPEKNGEFLLTPDGIPATVKRPGYSENARRAIANYRNGWYRVK